jgi:hypothetical protein
VTNELPATLDSTPDNNEGKARRADRKILQLVLSRQYLHAWPHPQIEVECRTLPRRVG